LARAGKELLVFVERLERQQKQLVAIPRSGKFGGTHGVTWCDVSDLMRAGAVGTFGAHVIALPSVDWCAFADQFCQSLGK
jgi:adenylosuccinate lyase